jgi:hypothetical protein
MALKIMTEKSFGNGFRDERKKKEWEFQDDEDGCAE